jgi:hypothetical protein
MAYFSELYRQSAEGTVEDKTVSIELSWRRAKKTMRRGAFLTEAPRHITVP